MEWILDKYNRLSDMRNMPMMVERGPFEQLLLQFDHPLKMLFLYHNGNQLEALLVHPLVFPHDLVRKDQRVLFCIKNQSDGAVCSKFRVRFSTNESVNNFCATIGKFIGVKAFDEWNHRSASPFSVDLTNASFTGINRSFADPDLSTSSTNLLNCFSQTSKFSSQDAPPFDISRATQKKLVDSHTQTVPDENTDPEPNCDKVHASSSSSTPPSASASSFHLHVENLFSTEAVHVFGNVLRQLVNNNNENSNKNNTNNKVETRGRKRKKHGTNVQAPKRPLNSYMLWNSGNLKRSVAEWGALPAEEKEHWKLLAADGRVRYKEQMEAYKKSQQN